MCTNTEDLNRIADRLDDPSRAIFHLSILAISERRELLANDLLTLTYAEPRLDGDVQLPADEELLRMLHSLPEGERGPWLRALMALNEDGDGMRMIRLLGLMRRRTAN
ncbi:hypothetical protein GQE99_18605 [Maritimibacter sp. DP07]|uniref:Uncharacterized protein n=1 Tax=Maritimibacter harenae TaxID=2606218 RepID=A0A845M4S9_9RHOB|nr:hypothetical protein [Maritimibacter harenae]MZR15035.1 hypothetical protein [Maritimibacter harenae]